MSVSRSALAGAFVGRPKFQFPQCAAIGGGNEKPLHRRLSRSGRKEAVCAGLRAVSRRKSAGNGTGAGTRLSPVKNAKPGELFWFITKGKLESGMPSWSNLSEQQRWQIVTFLESQAQHEDRSEVKSLKETLINQWDLRGKAQLVLSTCGRLRPSLKSGVRSEDLSSVSLQR